MTSQISKGMKQIICMQRAQSGGLCILPVQICRLGPLQSKLYQFANSFPALYQQYLKSPKRQELPCGNERVVLYYPKNVQRYNLNCREFAVSFYPYKELRRDVYLYQFVSLVELLQSSSPRLDLQLSGSSPDLTHTENMPRMLK